MARIVPSLQLAKTEDYILTPYTYTRIEKFFAYSILRAVLFSAASQAEVFARLARWQKVEIVEGIKN